MKQMIYLSVIIVAALIAYKLYRKSEHVKLFRAVTERFGDIPGLQEKSIEQLKAMLASAK